MRNELTITTHPSSDATLILRDGALWGKITNTESDMGYRTDVKIPGIPNFYAVFGYHYCEADAVQDLWNFLHQS